ncbi:PrsW family intramembrane metalloprotease [Candidatus Gracilibacteria bacterium]|nr:PrsW family intramembrane metalloprotease [Candidatus Gracilibacteria bacterium]
MSFIFLSFVAFWVALLPVYLWGYAMSYLLDTPWNRKRFILGMIIGGASVGMVWGFSYIKENQILYTILISTLFIAILSTMTFILIRNGSNIARIMLQKITLVNMNIIILILGISLFVSNQIEGGVILMISILPLLLSALIEESSKHLMSIGLMSQDFRFSRSDIIIFTLFVVLGFVFIENLLYLLKGNFSLTTWIFRSFFTLVAHLLSAILCAYAWWKALSYPPFSVQYISIFALGFTVAVITHLGYNLILGEGSMIGLGLYLLGAYLVVTRGIIPEKI